MNEIYCDGCGRLLAKLDGRAELKCPRCHTVEIYSSEKTTKNAEFDREVIKTQFIRRENALKRKERKYGDQGFTGIRL